MTGFKGTDTHGEKAGLVTSHAVEPKEKTAVYGDVSQPEEVIPADEEVIPTLPVSGPGSIQYEKDLDKLLEVDDDAKKG